MHRTKRDQHAFTRCQRGLHRSLNLDVCSDSQKTRKKRLVALIVPSLPTHSIGKHLDYAAAVECGSMHACSHLCAGMESRWCAISQGEHLSHRTLSLVGHFTFLYGCQSSLSSTRALLSNRTSVKASFPSSPLESTTTRVFQNVQRESL